jgi:hypothetical protein
VDLTVKLRFQNPSSQAPPIEVEYYIFLIDKNAGHGSLHLTSIPPSSISVRESTVTVGYLDLGATVVDALRRGRVHSNGSRNDVCEDPFRLNPHFQVLQRTLS